VQIIAIFSGGGLMDDESKVMMEQLGNLANDVLTEHNTFFIWRKPSSLSEMIMINIVGIR